MKGTIHYCLEETIVERFGLDMWHKCAKESGFGRDFTFVKMIRDDIDEQQSSNLFVKSAEVLGISLKELFDFFGEHFCCTYAPSLYGAFYAGISTTKKALTKIDWVHDRVTRNIPNAAPPKFDHNWHDENTLELTYKSTRGLIDLLISLIGGLNKYFNDACRVTKLSQTVILVEFIEGEGHTEVIDKTN